MATNSIIIPSSSMPPPPSSSHKYHVFLSFRGEDTRKTFTDHLYSNLVQAGVNTFRDDEELRKGTEIRSELIQAIEDSMISIVIFSKNYASSSWCLDELLKILECREQHGQLVIPIFYDVNPSEVRRQAGTFDKALSKHKKRFGKEKVARWKAAVKEAANLSGRDLQNVEDGHEAKFNKKLVEEVLKLVNPTCMHLPGLVIGPNSHAEGVISLCKFYSSTGVCMFGIYGMAGIGKTTVAKAVYNQIHRRYEGFSFVAHVRERSENNMLHNLQEQLLSEVLKKENFEIRYNVDMGKGIIKDRLGQKKVLIVLDDVDDMSQIKALAEERSWFGSGSIIIITTRSENLLDDVGVDYKYKVTRLDDISSRRLFCFHAFKDTTVPKNLDHELVKDIARLGGGVPLALEVLGSLLHKKDDQTWRSTLESLKNLAHHSSIHKALKVSYDSLDENSKEIFCDIACFFIEAQELYASLVLTGCGRSFSLGKGILTGRCLIKIKQNRLWMHDLVRDMAREIVRQESLKEPHMRSRLWFHEDVNYVLRKNKGSNLIEGISAIHPKVKDLTVDTKSFARMDRLKIFQGKGMNFTGSFKNLFEDLRWLSWQNFPLKCLPTDIHLTKLVALDMQYSNIMEVWQSTIKPLENLAYLNLSHCQRLKRTPDFSRAISLETILFTGCSELGEIDSSIKYLVKLVYLNLEDCVSLKNLPSSICKLESLQHLNMSGCSGLQQLPADLGHLKNLRSLSLQGCNRSLKAQSWLTSILSYVPWAGSSSSCPERLLPHSLSRLSHLTVLNLNDCRLSEADVPTNLGCLTSLKYLDLGGNDFYTLPSSLFCDLSQLQYLVLDNCKNLQMLSLLPSNLLKLHANDCSSIESLDMSNYSILPELYVSNCDRLSEIKGMETIENVEYVRIESSSKLARRFFDESFFQLTGECDKDLPYPSSYYIAGSEVPEWFSNRNIGSNITLTMPPNIEHNFQGMILWSIYESIHYEDFHYGPVLEVGDQTNKVTWVLGFPEITVTADKRSWVTFIPRDYFCPALEGGEQITFSFSIREQGFIGLKVTKCGVHPVYATAGITLPKLQFRDPRSNFEERRLIPLWRPSSIAGVGHVMSYNLNNGTDDQHIQKVIFWGLRLSEAGDGTSSFHNIIGTPFHVNHPNFRQILQEAYDHSRRNTADWRDLFCDVVVDQQNRLGLAKGSWNCWV
ncbi:disease resistance protein TAO1-like isoform X1 [Solanum tuberosum]|uniref:disease resistance protein TAO1-like isoform X1 n=1 Tax=Solanum tuberosum TaxID=4113 RepID=UPI00073A458A|nr:PREDICTED: disease resistance protein TAO1-like isoform X1 [Solanum tuberosum]